MDRSLLQGFLTGVFVVTYCYALGHDRGHKKEGRYEPANGQVLCSTAWTGVVSALLGAAILVFFMVWSLLLRRGSGHDAPMFLGLVVAVAGGFFLLLGWIKLRKRLIVDSKGITRTGLWGPRECVLKWEDVVDVAVRDVPKNTTTSTPIEYVNPCLSLTSATGETHALNLGRFPSRQAVLETILSVLPESACQDPEVRSYLKRIRKYAEKR